MVGEARGVTESVAGGGGKVEINDLPLASSITDVMQLETDTSGTLSQKITIGQLKNYIQEDVTVLLSDATGLTYWYYGLLVNGAWRINRIDVTTESMTQTEATQSNNGGYSDLNSAWAAKAGLNYAS